MKNRHLTSLSCISKSKIGVVQFVKQVAHEKNILSLKSKKGDILLNYLTTENGYWELDPQSKNVTNSGYSLVLQEKTKFKLSTRTIEVSFVPQTGKLNVTFCAKPIVKSPVDEGAVIHCKEYDILTERIPGNFTLKNDIIQWFEKQGATGYKINVNFGRDTDMFYNYCSWTETIGAPLAERIASEIYHESFGSKDYSEIRSFFKNYKTSESLGPSTISVTVSSLRKDCELKEASDMMVYDIGHRLFHKIEHTLIHEPPRKSFTDVFLEAFVSKAIVKKILASSMTHLAERFTLRNKRNYITAHNQ